MAMSDYRAPRMDAPNDHKLGWLKEQLSGARTFVQNQLSYPDIDKVMDILFSSNPEKQSSKLSNVRVNLIKRALREIVASQANIRPSWSYTSDNEDYDRTGDQLNRSLRAWWLNTFADRKVREALQFANVLGTGYVSPRWKPDFWVRGRGDIALDVYGPDEVLPFMMGRDNDLQGAYAVTICVSVPLAQAHAMYPLAQNVIRPSRAQAGWVRRGLEKVRRFAAPALNVSPIHDSAQQDNFPEVDLYYTYVLDLTYNQTGTVVPMGEPGSSWYYEVPSVGDSIPTTMFTGTGERLFRKATWKDCQLYPTRRLIVWTDDAVLDDGPSPYWHGKVPAVRFTMDDWPWSSLGFSMVHDVASLQNGINELFRAVNDAAKVRLRPGVLYDENSLSKTLMDAIDTRQEGQAVGTNLSMGDVIKTILPPAFYEVPPWLTNHIGSMQELLKYQLALPDILAMAKGKQIPGSDSLEKILEQAGPIPADMARGTEASLRELGEMWKALAFQFYDSARRLQMFGDDDKSVEEFRFDPNLMVPSHMPGEPQERASAYTRIQRAMWFSDQFVFHVTPGQLHQITTMTRRLMNFQLWRSGFPMDPWTMAESFDIANFGRPPEGANTVMERWEAWNKMKAELAQELQGAPNELQQLLGAIQKGAGKRGGRPPSGQAAPQLKTKDGGTRTTVTESR